jgi:hypothetical protein
MPPAYVDDNHVQEAVGDDITDGAHQLNGSTKDQIKSDFAFPRDSKEPGVRFDMKEKPHPTVDTNFVLRRVPTDIPPSPLRTAVEGAFQLAAETYFKGGAFTKAMSETALRLSALTDTDDPENKNSAATSYQLIPSSKGRKGSVGRICREASATGTLFGTVWSQTTSVRSDFNPGKNFNDVTSYTFFPSWWLNQLGVKRGMQLNLCGTATGWQFNIDPVRAVQEDSPIFKFCKSGNIAAVRELITDGSASVRDTSPKGLQPLHVSSVYLLFVNSSISNIVQFAVCADEINVELCEFLVSEGADKTALAYEGPSKDALYVLGSTPTAV